MTKFRDNLGREWMVELNISAVRRVRDRLGVEILTKDPLSMLNAVLDNPMTLCDVLFVLVEDQAKAAGVTDEEFGRGLGGDSLEAGARAFLDSVVGFTPNPRDRARVQKLIDTLFEVAEKTRDRLDEQLDRIRGSVDQIAAAAHGERSTASPGSPESNPDP